MGIIKSVCYFVLAGLCEIGGVADILSGCGFVKANLLGMHSWAQLCSRFMG